MAKVTSGRMSLFRLTVPATTQYIMVEKDPGPGKEIVTEGTRSWLASNIILRKQKVQ